MSVLQNVVFYAFSPECSDDRKVQSSTTGMRSTGKV